jgi:hypothetical protein
LKKLASVLLVVVLVCCAAACVMPVLAHPQDHYVSYNGSKTEDGYDVVVIQRFCTRCNEPLPLNTSQRVILCDVCAKDMPPYAFVITVCMGASLVVVVAGCFVMFRSD